MPEGLRWFFRVVVGEDWPIGDEDQMRRLAAVWDAFAAKLDGVENEILAARARLNAAGSGPGMDAADQWLGSVLEPDPGNGNASPVAALSQGARTLAEFCRKIALEIEYAKYMCLGMLIWLAWELAQLAWAAWVSFGSAGAAAPR